MFEPLPGTWCKVFRIVPVAALVLVVVAGCGDASRPQGSALGGVPPVLAHDWEGQATAIASAASAGDSCGALRLADSLRAQILASEHKLPPRLRSPLVTGVNALVDRLTCTVTTTTKPPPKQPGQKHDHHDHGKHKHGDGGKNDQ
jgi:hypothetical protein